MGMGSGMRRLRSSSEARLHTRIGKPSTKVTGLGSGPAYLGLALLSGCGMTRITRTSSSRKWLNQFAGPSPWSTAVHKSSQTRTVTCLPALGFNTTLSAFSPGALRTSESLVTSGTSCASLGCVRWLMNLPVLSTAIQLRSHSNPVVPITTLDFACPRADLNG